MSVTHATEGFPWFCRRSGNTAHAKDARSPFETDYARVIHSSWFRRLQGKTQILALGDDDFYRTRLTHSMEVAQLGLGIIQQLHHRGKLSSKQHLAPPAPLVSTCGLAHDLGHPPFGHGGELALNYCMRDAGGFEGNAQTLRILTTLGEYTRNFGADLTRRSLLGVLKYPVLWSQARNAHIRPALSPSPTTIAVLDRSSCKPPKACYDGDAEVLEWILDACSPDDSERFRAIAPSVDRHGKALHKSFDCSVMNLADDIAYGVHDLEDAIALGLISENSFYSALSPVARELISDSLASHPLVDVGAYDAFVTSLFSDAGARKRAIGRLVHVLLRGVEIAADPSFDEPLLANYVHLTDEPRRLLEALQALVVAEVINSAKVQQLEFKGERMVVAVFEAIISEPDRLLPELIRREFDASKNPHRVLCDHISAMTDAALLKTYDRLFSPRMGSVFDRL